MKRFLYCLLLSLFLSSCRDSSCVHKIENSYGNIPFRLLVSSSLSQETLQQISQIVEETFSEMDAIYNEWNPHSEISRLNAFPAHETFTLSPQLFHLLTLIHGLVHLTEGRFDPTVAPLSKLWKESLSQGKLPNRLALLERESAVGFHHLHLEKGICWKDHALTSLDLGGISKGYTLDCLAEKLQQAHIDSFYLEWGGEIRTQGHHPQGRLWKVDVWGLTTLEMESDSLATSGDYFQYWEVEGVTYTHILNPHSLQPLQPYSHGIHTTCVRASSCAIADALATALMLFPSAEEARQWVETLQGSLTCWIGTDMPSYSECK